MSLHSVANGVKPWEKKSRPSCFFFFLGLYYSISLQSLTGLERGLLLLTGFVEIWQRKKHFWTIWRQRCRSLLLFWQQVYRNWQDNVCGCVDTYARSNDFIERPVRAKCFDTQTRGTHSRRLKVANAHKWSAGTQFTTQAGACGRWFTHVRCETLTTITLNRENVVKRYNVNWENERKKERERSRLCATCTVVGLDPN